MTVMVKHADTAMLKAIKSIARLSPGVKIKVKKTPRVQLTENGFTPEFENEILEAMADVEEKRKNGTLRTFDSMEEYRKSLDE